MTSAAAIVSSKTDSTATAQMPRITLLSFFDPGKPWVLVPNGSLLGYFDWVPEHLRIGPWSPVAFVALGVIISMLMYLKPDEFLASEHFRTATLVSSHPELYSQYWWYNCIAFLFMSYIALYILIVRAKGVIVAFTIQSWCMNSVRHGIHTLAPFLYDHHLLFKINQVLRFPALVSASFTFLVWNIVLLPFITYYAMDTVEKRREFMKWNCSFRMVQIHISNIIYAMVNTLLSGSRVGLPPQFFTQEDLWYGLVYVFSYGLFYMLVLDRLGVHLYPVFSPRTKFVAVTWALAMIGVYGLFLQWNDILKRFMDELTLPAMLGLNLLVVGGGFLASYFLNRK